MVYDVFLSFRGKDTRNKFTAHLYTALLREEINTYMDKHIRIGKKISKALLKAIENSRIAIIILSSNYAESGWCLDELIKILECKEKKQQIVVPIFYDVKPSEVQNQTGSVGKAFAKLEVKFKNDVKLDTWKNALKTVAKLSGHHLRSRDESKFIQKIIQELQLSLPKVGMKNQRSAQRICAGCNTEIRRGKDLTRMGDPWHPKCFHCHACNQPITGHEFSESGNPPYHVSCYRAQSRPISIVSNGFGMPRLTGFLTLTLGDNPVRDPMTQSLHPKKRPLIISIFHGLLGNKGCIKK